MATRWHNLHGNQVKLMPAADIASDGFCESPDAADALIVDAILHVHLDDNSFGGLVSSVAQDPWQARKSPSTPQTRWEASPSSSEPVIHCRYVDHDPMDFSTLESLDSSLISTDTTTESMARFYGGSRCNCGRKYGEAGFGAFEDL